MYFVTPTTPQSPRVGSTHGTEHSPAPPPPPSDLNNSTSGFPAGAVPVPYYVHGPYRHPQPLLQQAAPMLYETCWVDRNSAPVMMAPPSPQQQQQLQLSLSYERNAAVTLAGDGAPPILCSPEALRQLPSQCVWISAYDGVAAAPPTPLAKSAGGNRCVFVSPGSCGATPSPSTSTFHAGSPSLSTSNMPVPGPEEEAPRVAPMRAPSLGYLLSSSTTPQPFLIHTPLCTGFPTGPPNAAGVALSNTHSPRLNSGLYTMRARYLGRVKRYNKVRGYGFLSATHQIVTRPAQPSAETAAAITGAAAVPEVEEHIPVQIGDIFVHHYYIMPPDTELLVGASVIFTVGPYEDERGEHHSQAVSVEVQAPCGQLLPKVRAEAEKGVEAAVPMLPVNAGEELGDELLEFIAEITMDEP